ncbi:MAG TPA: DUF1254 domain-containing protein [Chitinophagaceae bacterium]
MKIKIALLFILIPTAFGIISCNQSQKSPSEENAAKATNDEQIIRAFKDAYVFGYPLVVMNATQRVMTNVEKASNEGGKITAPVNQLISANLFPDDKFRDVVRANNDTYYSSAWLDLGNEPLVLQLPNTNGRYFLFPMLDAWTNVFFSPGKRTTGTEVQTYLITSSNWTGEVPKGMQQVKSPTKTVWMIGRTQVNSARDGATAVKQIQEKYKLLPLSAWGKPYTAPAGKIDPGVPKKAPNDIVTDMPVSDYFNLLNQLMVDNPPAAADSGFLKKLVPLGIAPGSTFDMSKFSAAVQDSLKSIPAWAKNYMSQSGLSDNKPVNGWSVSKGLGNYGTNYMFRAGVAYNGLGANLDADAVYPASLTDANGDAYDGSTQKYVLHFEKGEEPPSNAFWSLTMYDNEGFLCANPINRFAIGDRNALQKNADGSLDIYIQKDNPGKDKENNWLPAPNGPFNLLLRVYWPKEEIMNGSWAPPGVKKQS